MNNMLNIHQSLSKTKQTLPIFISAINENQIYQNKKSNEIEPVLGLISQLLRYPHSFNEGLQFLDEYLNQYSEHELTSKAITWIQLLFDKLNHQTNKDNELIYKVLTKLITVSSSYREINKAIEDKYVQLAVEKIIAKNSIPNVESLKLLEVCLKLFGGKCGQFKRQIESVCLNTVDIQNDIIVEQAAKCLHYLQQTRGGGQSGGVYKKCWFEYLTQVIGTLEDLQGTIFKNFTDTEVNHAKSEKLKLDDLKLSPEPVEKYGVLYIRFKNVCKFLEVALLEPFPVSKSIQFNRILSLVETVLLIDQLIIERKSITDNIVLGAIVSQIHQQMLKLLRVLIILMQGNISIKSKTICELLSKILKRTGTKNADDVRVLKQLRISCYETLNCFMHNSKNNIYVKSISENLLQEIFVDITPLSNKIVLMIQNKQSSKKRKNNVESAGSFSKNPKSNIGSNVDLQELCIQALETLIVLLNTNGTLLKPVLHKIIQDKIISIGFELISKYPDTSGDFYETAECRLKLLEAVTTIVKNSSPVCPPSLSYTKEILTKSMQLDPDFVVRENCSDFLTLVEKVIHPKKEIFYFPTDMKELQDTIKFNQQTLRKFQTNQDQNNIEKNDNSPSINEENDEFEMEVDGTADDNPTIEINSRSQSPIQLESAAVVPDTEQTDEVILLDSPEPNNDNEIEEVPQVTPDEKIEDDDCPSPKRQKITKTSENTDTNPNSEDAQEENKNEDELFNSLVADFVDEPVVLE